MISTRSTELERPGTEMGGCDRPYCLTTGGVRLGRGTGPDMPGAGTGLETGGALPEPKPEEGGTDEGSRLRPLGAGGTDASTAATEDVVDGCVGGIDEGDDLPSCGLRRVGA